MELNQVKIIIEKYFEGTSSIAEENELKAYFSSDDVAPELMQYQPIFGYFKNQKETQFNKSLPLQPRKQQYVKWIGIAASFVFLFGMLTFYFNQKTSEDLGTFDNPEEAFVATQNALRMVSEQVNYGIGGVAVLQEYEQSKNTIFKNKK